MTVQNPIFMRAPAANMTFASLPSGSTYVSDNNGLIYITNGSVADQLALIAAGCVTLSPIAGGAASVQNGTAYTLQTSDQNNEILFTSNSAVAVTLPNSFPVGFIAELYQLGTGTVTASAASGGSVVTPNISNTPNQYSSLLCIVVSNSTGTNAQWNVIAEPLQNGGLVGAATLSGLYSQDSSAHYAQYSIGNVFNDSVAFTGSISGTVLTASSVTGAFAVGQTLAGSGVAANATIASFGSGTGGAGTYNINNSQTVSSESMTAQGNGTWLKTGSGNGSGNWTQESTVTLQMVNTAVTNEIVRAESSEQGIFQALGSYYAWADDPLFPAGIFDESGHPIIAPTASNVLVGSAADTLTRVAYGWADDTYFGSIGNIGAGVMPLVDASGNIIVPMGAVPGPMDDYCPYVNKVDGSLHATNTDPITSGINVMIANTRGNATTGGISGIHQMGPILKWVDDATASGQAPFVERRQFDWRCGSYLANLGSSITKIVHVIDTGHSLTIGGTDHSPITVTPFFSRGVMFNSGPKVLPANSGGYAKPRPLTADLYLQTLSEYFESDCDSTGGESHGSGLVTWLSTGSNLGSTEAIMFSTVGAGGNLMADLLSGQPCYLDLTRCVERSAAIAKANGWAWECYVLCSIGENDYITYATNASGFQTNMIACQASFQTAIQSIFTQNGWSAPAYIPMICEQPSSWTDPNYELTTCALAYVFPSLARTYPNLFKLVGPSYYTNHYNSGAPGNSIHKTSLGYKLDGEYEGRAVQKIRAAAQVPGLYVTGVSNSGSTLTITTNATTNLAIDTTVVNDPNGQSGLRVLDVTSGNTNIALSGISVSGTTITATLASHTAGHTLMLGVGDIGTAGNVAGPTTGPRTTIRDSSTDVSSSDTSSTPMYNYLSHDQFQFTASA